MTNADKVRTEVRDWLDANWEPSLDLAAWRRVLVDSGWGHPTWPVEWYGRGLDKALARVVAEEFAERQVPGLVTGGVTGGMAAPTLLTHGTDAIRRRYLPPLLAGEESWCQLFSEPGAGSDAAGATTRADRHGDEWIVNGQKVWTSGALQARFGLLLCRTDWDVPKHEGLSYFVLDMKQPGVEVRPIKMISGGSGFNEVFMSDARVPHDNLLGELNGGWAVAITTLMNERVSIGGGNVTVGVQPQVQMSPEQRSQFAGMTRVNPIELAKQNGKSKDLVIRQELMRLYTLQRVSQWNNQRSRATQLSGGRPGPEGSLAKLAGSEIARRSARIAALVAGADAMLLSGAGAQQLGYHSSSIAGGTDNIQKNIVGERVLGLPKDPQMDAGVPYREVRTNTRP